MLLIEMFNFTIVVFIVCKKKQFLIVNVSFNPSQ